MLGFLQSDEEETKTALGKVADKLDALLFDPVSEVVSVPT